MPTASVAFGTRLCLNRTWRPRQKPEPAICHSDRNLT